jgi:predicted transcriptional regulator
MSIAITNPYSPADRPTVVKLDQNLHERIKQLAQARQRTAHWIMQEAITRYVSHEEKREQFRQETLAAWEHFSATGEHVSEAAADAWLDQLAQGRDLDLPASRA